MLPFNAICLQNSDWKQMKINRYFTTLLSLLLLLSCKTEKETSPVPVLNLARVLEGDKTIELSEMNCKIETVQLETNENVLINRINNIILSKEHFIVVHDRQCAVFDLKGNFIRKISSRGQGPQEYVSIVNLSLIGDKLFIFDVTKTFFNRLLFVNL